MPSSTSFTEDDGTSRAKTIERPAVLNAYYSASHLIDRHNHLRQGELQFEKYWKTKCPWFRLVTTIVFGLTVTDAFLLAKHSVASDHPIQRMNVKEFAARVAYDLHNMSFQETRNSLLRTIPSIQVAAQQQIENSDGPTSTTSHLSQFTFQSNVSETDDEFKFRYAAYPVDAPWVPRETIVKHPIGTLKQGDFTDPRPLRQSCEDPLCTYRTALYCMTCNKRYCTDNFDQSHGRCCFYAHVCEHYNKSGSAPTLFKKNLKIWQQLRLKYLTRKPKAKKGDGK